MFLPEPVWESVDDTAADTELILPVSLEVAQLGVVIVGLHHANPEVLRDGQVHSAADDHGEGAVEAGRILEYFVLSILCRSYSQLQEDGPRGRTAVWTLKDLQNHSSFQFNVQVTFNIPCVLQKREENS